MTRAPVEKRIDVSTFMPVTHNSHRSLITVLPLLANGERCAHPQVKVISEERRCWRWCPSALNAPTAMLRRNIIDLLTRIISIRWKADARTRRPGSPCDSRSRFDMSTLMPSFE